MPRKERIVRFSAEEIRKKLIGGESKTDWRRVKGNASEGKLSGLRKRKKGHYLKAGRAPLRLVCLNQNRSSYQAGPRCGALVQNAWAWLSDSNQRRAARLCECPPAFRTNRASRQMRS